MGDNHEGYTMNADISTSTHTQRETFESVLQAYMSRRTLLKKAVSSLVLA